MGYTISPDHTGTIHAKTDRQALDCYIVHDRVISSLQKCRIYRCKGFQAFCGKSSTKRHSMLFCYSDIKSSIREHSTKFIKACSRGHSRIYRNNFIVSFRLSDKRGGKNTRIGGGALRCSRQCSCNHIKFSNTMIFILSFFSRRIPTTFFRNNVDDNRSILFRITNIP